MLLFKVGGPWCQPDSCGRWKNRVGFTDITRNLPYRERPCCLCCRTYVSGQEAVELVDFET
ncbi:hypothetical protein DPMN_062752 [Dreissena polymorpha]|uniref:Uncharacterized protein n=1 Tax=Dreissena polymorpha TaxID=45954 RepID=A0A9D4HJL7_DREPO|nr:hypothetical protein DPMN_062752 [Dreissena polymorpha]